MKKTLFILAIALGVVSQAKSQTAPLNATDSLLIQAYANYDSAKTYPQWLMATNQFKLIAKQSPDYWLANYYAAWSIAVTSFSEPTKSKKDPMLDEADAFYAKIELMDSTNDEIALLGSLLAQARLSVDPMSRHSKYGKISDGYQALVTKLNPNNPRMYYLQGNSKFYTPKAFGGGKDKAEVLYEKAETLFANDSKDIRKPHWGKAPTDKMLAQCKDKNKK